PATYPSIELSIANLAGFVLLESHPRPILPRFGWGSPIPPGTTFPFKYGSDGIPPALHRNPHSREAASIPKGQRSFATILCDNGDNG
ncbi:MAG: hypothetical protein WBF52_06110, partial [Geitlerinemataceae cyanobacterium]